MLAYHRLLTAGRPSRWWVLLGVALVVVFFLVAQTVAAGVIAAVLILGGLPTDVALDRLSGTGEVTPSFLALVNLGWAAAIPAVVLAVWLVHGLHPGWAVSVVRRVRWGWFATCLGLSLVALVATLLVSAVLPAQGNGAEITGELNSWSRTMRDFLLVVVLLTPLQAAGEEFAFRGYLTQAVGTLVCRPRRSSSTASPSVSSRASWCWPPGGSRRASRCTCSTTCSPSAWRWPSAT